MFVVFPSGKHLACKKCFGTLFKTKARGFNQTHMEKSLSRYWHFCC